MDRYSRRNTEELVVPNNYHETSYTSQSHHDVWDGSWNMNNSSLEEEEEAAADKCFDYDVINNGFSGGLYSQMDITTSHDDDKEVKKDSKRTKNNGCFYNSLDDFDGIQHMDDSFLSSILEDVPRDVDDNNSPGSSTAYNLDSFDGSEVPMFGYNWETCPQDMPIMEEEEEDAPMNLCEEDTSAEEVVLQDLQRASEKLTDDTRKCFRDTFYRLAKNSQQKSESGNSHPQEFFEDGTRKKVNELGTNSIDRAVANLTFNKMESNMRNHPKRVSSIQG
ncbi:unnamed protein product [Cochlearia groenlandica]